MNININNPLIWEQLEKYAKELDEQFKKLTAGIAVNETVYKMFIEEVEKFTPTVKFLLNPITMYIHNGLSNNEAMILTNENMKEFMIVESEKGTMIFRKSNITMDFDWGEPHKPDFML